MQHTTPSGQNCKKVADSFTAVLRPSWLEDGALFSKYGSLKANRSIVSKSNKSHPSVVGAADRSANFIHLTKRGSGERWNH